MQHPLFEKLNVKNFNAFKNIIIRIEGGIRQLTDDPAIIKLVKEKQYSLNTLNKLRDMYGGDKHKDDLVDLTEDIVDGFVDIIYYIFDSLYSCFGKSISNELCQAAYDLYLQVGKEFTEPCRGPPNPDNWPNKSQFLSVAFISEYIEIYERINFTSGLDYTAAIIANKSWLYGVTNSVDVFIQIINYLFDTPITPLIAAAFVEVHSANLRKRWYNPELKTYEYKLGAEVAGVKKILKPEGWYGPSNTKLIEKFLETSIIQNC